MLLDEILDLINLKLVAQPLMRHDRILGLVALSVKVADLTASISDQLVVDGFISLLVSGATVQTPIIIPPMGDDQLLSKFYAYLFLL